ncbi:acyltransferase family protein [Streptomyces griseoluteus]|uniref:acyltransferase family protein n=1 Tax=Streptomyces griseoluteus TaxID=29306 RepID=UPI00370071CD
MFDASPSPGQTREPTPPAAQPVPERSAKRRDSFFDNAKYLAIVLVAMGHSWEALYADSRVLRSLYIFVYTFHMPAFIIISGYFSRSFDMRPDRLKRLITGVAVPYVVFETAYSLFRDHFGQDGERGITLLDPYFLSWFLAALFVWRLTTPLWKVVRWPLPLALAIAMLATVSPAISNDLDFQRLLQFLPCFVLGLCLKPEHFRMVRTRTMRIASVPVVAGALAVAWLVVPHIDFGWFYRRDAAQEMGAPWWAGPLMALALFACSVVLTACFLAWVPGRRMWFTSLGAGTICGYLLHGFVLKYTRWEGWYDAHWLHSPLGALLVTAFAVTVVTLLCTAPVRRVFRCVMEPKMEWAFKQDPAQQARERQHGGQKQPVREKAGV